MSSQLETRRVRLMTTAPRPKYGNKKTEIDGHKFDSMKEAARYQALKMLLAAGRIRNLQLQPIYPLMVNGAKVCSYKADFTYEEYAHGSWAKVVEDVKGMQTPVYRLKKKLVRLILGIEIRET